MSYTPTADGTQVFGIPDSPVTINSVTYIAEDIKINDGTRIEVIRDDKGVPTGQNIVQDNITGTAKLQKASGATAKPPKGTIFTLSGKSYYVTDVSDEYTQGGYSYYNISFVWKIN